MGNQHVLTNHYSKAKFLIGSIDSCGSETLKVKYSTTLATVFLLGPISCPRDICDDLFYVLEEGNQWRGEKKKREARAPWKFHHKWRGKCHLFRWVAGSIPCQCMICIFPYRRKNTWYPFARNFSMILVKY
jgi:hypothetical protein